MEARRFALTTRPIDEVMFELLAETGERSLAPEAVARAAAGEDWRRVLPQVRSVARGLARQGRITVLRHGKPADPEAFRGVYRIARPREG